MPPFDKRKQTLKTDRLRRFLFTINLGFYIRKIPTCIIYSSCKYFFETF